MPSEGPINGEQLPMIRTVRKKAKDRSGLAECAQSSDINSEKRYGTRFVDQVCLKVLALIKDQVPSLSLGDMPEIQRVVREVVTRHISGAPLTAAETEALKDMPMQTIIRAEIRRVLEERHAGRSRSLRSARALKGRHQSSLLSADSDHNQESQWVERSAPMGSQSTFTDDQMLDDFEAEANEWTSPKPPKSEEILMPLVDDGTDTSETTKAASRQEKIRA